MAEITMKPEIQFVDTCSPGTMKFEITYASHDKNLDRGNVQASYKYNADKTMIQFCFVGKTRREKYEHFSGLIPAGAIAFTTNNKEAEVDLLYSGHIRATYRVSTEGTDKAIVEEKF